MAVKGRGKGFFKKSSGTLLLNAIPSLGDKKNLVDGEANKPLHAIWRIWSFIL